jgi:hypothetical protein
MDDLTEVPVPDPFRLEVYWLRIGGEEGPAASLYLDGEELVRFDCLPRTPHLHYGFTDQRYWEGQHRVFFPPGDLDDHIERATFELARNTPYSTSLHRRRRVRTMELDEAGLEDAARRMGEEMRRLVARRQA